MHTTYKILLGVGLVIAWFFRSFLPFLFLNNEGIDVILNVPDNIAPRLNSTYSSSSCQYINLYNFKLKNAKKHHQFKLEKVTDNQYRAKVNYSDNSLCRWSLKSLGWSLNYIDAAKVDPRAVSGSGGGVGITISFGRWDEALAKSNGERYIEDQILTLSQVFIPEIDNQTSYGTLRDYRIYLEAEKKSKKIYFNPFVHSDPRIEYTATIDYSQLKDLSK